MGVDLVIGVCSLFGGAILATDLLYYLFCTPPISRTPTAPRSIKHLSLFLYAAAYLIGILRIPYIVLPYLTKLGLFLLLRRRLWRLWSLYLFQVIRLCGDLFNLIATTVLMVVLSRVLPSLGNLMRLAIEVCFAAECIRLMTEKGQMVFSAVWQLLPHRWIASRIPNTSIFSRYRAYYMLPPHQRLEAILRWLKICAAGDREVADKLDYVSVFRVVPTQEGLRTGAVRDIAHGEIFIHASWTNDPWLLIGQALRRSPWVFDPRYLSRPFYYRSQSNRLSTLMVLQCAFYSPPYAWYQFGHEVKVARYDLFFRAARWLGIDLESPVQADGIYRAESTPPLARKFAQRHTRNAAPSLD